MKLLKLSNINILLFSIAWVSSLILFPLSVFSRTSVNNLYEARATLFHEVDTVKPQELETATVTATRLLLVTRGDTTIYDLDALNIKESALLREAFMKLPGMSFRDGKLYHNGQEVKRVLINGLDFSTKDPLLALHALPAYIMKNVKVYERQSEFTERTGIDDGQLELVADVSVRRKYMGVWTGELAFGMGTDERFLAKGFGNTFTDDFRISLFGNANNINRQMWYNGDGQERAGTEQPGDNEFYTPGMTFLWKNKKSLKEKGYFKISGGLDYNKELYDREALERSESYLSDGSLFSASRTIGNTNKDRFAGNLNMDWNISKVLSASYKSSFDLSRSKGNSNMLKADWNGVPIILDESIPSALNDLLYSDGKDPEAIDLQQNEKSFLRCGSDYQHRLGFSYANPESRTYLNFGHKLNLGSDTQEDIQDIYYKYFNQEAYRSYGLSRTLDAKTHKNSQGVIFSVMQYFTIKGFSFFCLSSGYSYTQDHTTYDGAGYLTHSNSFMSQTQSVDDETTRFWNEKGHQHKIDAGLSIRKGFLVFEFKPELHIKHSHLNYHKHNLSEISIQRDYIYWKLMTQLLARSAKIGTAYVRYHIDPNIPNIHDLVRYPDKSDPQYILMGNENLAMGYRHTLNGLYNRNFVQEREKGKLTRTLLVHTVYSRLSNDIARFTTYDRNTGVVTTQPVNVSGNWNAKVYISFTTPFDIAQRFWLETSAEALITKTQTFSGTESFENATMEVNDNRLYAYKASIKPRLRLKTIDFTLGYELIFEENHATYFSANNKKQWQHLISGKLNWQLPFDINLEANCRYHNYGSYLTGKREHWTMLDLELERSFFKKKNLFVALSVHDLFNNNDGFSQTYSATALTQSYHRTLDRYAMLTLRYRFSSKKE